MHDGGLFQPQLRHPRVDRVAADTIENHVRRRVVTDDDHQVHQVSDGEGIPGGELRQDAAAPYFVLVGEHELLVPVELSPLRLQQRAPP